MIVNELRWRSGEFTTARVTVLSFPTFGGLGGKVLVPRELSERIKQLRQPDFVRVKTHRPASAKPKFQLQRQLTKYGVAAAASAVTLGAADEASGAITVTTVISRQVNPPSWSSSPWAPPV